MPNSIAPKLLHKPAAGSFQSRPRLARSPVPPLHDDDYEPSGAEAPADPTDGAGALPNGQTSAEAEDTADVDAAAAEQAARILSLSWDGTDGGAPWYAAEPRPETKHTLPHHRRFGSDGAPTSPGLGLAGVQASFSRLRTHEAVGAPRTANVSTIPTMSHVVAPPICGGAPATRDACATSDTRTCLSMANWHGLISLQPGAPVVYEGAHGIVRRANPARGSYAIHLLAEQRTIDVPFDAANLHADVTATSMDAPAEHAAQSATTRSSLSGGSGSGGKGLDGVRARLAARERARPTSRGTSSSSRSMSPIRRPVSKAQCFSSVRMM